ncbi:hypothetical protein [Corynebacterium casei]|uniref:hypothetical protein n=1 Tax=Corynebacterium casei TaxID=160386 RepID=UPI003FD5D6CD
MPKTVILVRCQKWEPRVKELVNQLQHSLPKWTIYAVPDCISLSSDERDEVCEEFEIPVLPLTLDFVEENGLHAQKTRTGWVCGDYVIYRALEEDWEYAWVIEPDVYFLNGAESIIDRLQKLDHDLLATHLWKAGDGWVWTPVLRDLLPDLKVHAMAFPFFRISRRVAVQALRLRQEITPLLSPAAKIPNDESVLATAAFNSHASMLDIRSLYEEHFHTWSTVTKASIEDIQQSRSEPLVVHSGQTREKFVNQMHSYWKGAMEGSDFCRTQLFRSLDTASKDTVISFLERALDSVGNN